MKTMSIYLLVFSVVLLIFCLHIEAVLPVKVVQPYGIESVDGSDINMGCTSPLVNSSDGVMICKSQSYLVDGCSPAINTSTSDWASQLVTVRKTQNDRVTFDGNPFDHVLLTFGFDTAVTLTGIELDLFLCPDMNIHAPFIRVLADEESNLVFTHDSFTSLPFQFYIPSQSSCDSLSTITITFSDSLTGPYLTWHILVYFSTSSIHWVYVGEIRFLSMDTEHVSPGSGQVYNSQAPADMTITQTRCSRKTTLPVSSFSNQLVPTSLTEGPQTCSNCGTSSVIVVSAVSLLLIVILITVIIIQCLLIFRMRKSKDVLHSSNETNVESSMNVDVPTTPNKAYTLYKIITPSEDATYETVN